MLAKELKYGNDARKAMKKNKWLESICFVGKAANLHF